MTRPYQSSVRRGFWRLWSAVCKKYGWENSRENRHLLYRRALGYDKAQNQFGHKEWDLVFDELRRNLKGLISEGPESLAGVAEAGERARKVHAIRQLQVEAYIIKVAEDKFGVFADWTNLPLGQLEQLRITLIERQRAQQRKQQAEMRQYKLDLARINQGLQADNPPAKPAEKLQTLGADVLPPGNLTDSYYEQ